VPLRLPVRLIATATEHKISYAVFINDHNGKVEVWPVGQTIDSARLVGVQVDHVEFETAGRRWTMTVPQDFREAVSR
jgi:hypothetical protein